MVSRLPQRSTRLPRHGYGLVAVTVRDANGFLHHYPDIETPIGVAQEAIALMQLHSDAAAPAASQDASA